MYKHLLLILALIYSHRSYGQDESWVVDEVTEEICSLLISKHNDKTATKGEINEIFYGTILKLRNTWNPPMGKLFPDSDQDMRNSAYYTIINQKLLLNCPAFEQYDEVIDKTFKANESRRKQYLNVKKFVVSAENMSDNRTLLEQFDNSLNKEELEVELKKLKTELSKYKKPSMLQHCKQ